MTNRGFRFNPSGGELSLKGEGSIFVEASSTQRTQHRVGYRKEELMVAEVLAIIEFVDAIPWGSDYEIEIGTTFV